MSTSNVLFLLTGIFLGALLTVIVIGLVLEKVGRGHLPEDD